MGNKSRNPRLLCLAAFSILMVTTQSSAQEVPSDPDRYDQTTYDLPARDSLRRSIFKLKIPQAALPPDKQARVDDNCHFGQPRRIPNTEIGPTELVCRDGYILEHSSEWKVPLWVAERCTKEEINGALPRTNPFRPDPELKRGERAELSDYRGSGKDRGHLAPNANQQVDNELRIQTFFLSNIVPQTGKGFNQSIWADLEDQVRNWAKKRGEVWIVTGSMFYDPAEEDPRRADGLVDVLVIGDNEVVVPTHLFKIVLAKNSSGKWESLAFVFENKSYSPDEKIEDHLQSIDWIEDRVGFDFFPAAQAETGEPDIEQRLEAKAAIALWN